MAQNIVGSKMTDFPPIQPAKRDNTKTGYGQNGYSGASSDTDLSNPTRSALSVELFPPRTPVNEQLRKIKADPLPTTFGMHNPNAK